jgi:transposase
LSPAVGVPQATGQTLHQALRAYQEHVRHEYRVGTDGITDNGKSKIDQIKSVLSYVPDVDLATLDYRGCDEVFGVFRRRPVSKRYGLPMTRKSCTNLIGELGRFFLWLHTSPAWAWRRPEDFDLIKRTPRELDEDVERMAASVPTWTVEQLAVLNQYALPLERVFFLLGLNCAYGADQAGRLRIPHLHLSEEEGKPSYIRRIRRKKKVLAMHLLWPQTVTAMKWALERRKGQKNDKDFLLLTDTGLPYWRQTKGGNRAQLIPNLWKRLLDRVRKDHPDFPRLPFNSLRDTSCDMIRSIAGEETASVHVAHKHQSRDENLGRYSNPVRRRHFKALRALAKKLQPVFAAAGPEPFQPGPRSSIGLAKVKQIQDFYAEGMPIMEIARRLDVSQGTVYRHIKK